MRYTNTGYKGVSLESRIKGDRKYKSSFAFNIGKNKLSKFIGYYESPELAYIARIKYIDSLK